MQNFFVQEKNSFSRKSSLKIHEMTRRTERNWIIVSVCSLFLSIDNDIIKTAQQVFAKYLFFIIVHVLLEMSLVAYITRYYVEDKLTDSNVTFVF